MHNHRLDELRKRLGAIDRDVQKAENAILRMPANADIGEVTKLRGALKESLGKREKIVRAIARLEEV